jgi:7-cyano-7-deazaguanine synthase
MEITQGKAIVLLSGGMDSVTCFYQAVKDRGAKNIIPVFFYYGQRSYMAEMTAVNRIITLTGTCEKVDIDVFTSFFELESALTNPNSELPERRTPEEISAGGIPSSFVPGRNIIFFSYAFGLAYIYGAEAIYAGMNDEDTTGYPDCKKDFLTKMEKAGSSGIARDIKLVLPVIGKTKAEIVKKGEKLGVPWQNTVSCYKQTIPDIPPCGICDSCVLRKKGFEEAGVNDPTVNHPSFTEGVSDGVF